MRTAATCHPDKPNFGGGLCPRCYGRKWYRENRERSKEHKRQWRKANPEKQALIHRNAGYKKRHGITLATFNEMGAAQNWCCAICGHATHELVLDHDHKDGRRRKLLCQSCNLGLGKFNDDPTRLEAAAVYLRTYEKIKGVAK